MAANIKINVDNKQAVQKVNEVVTKVNEAQNAASKPLKIGNQGIDKIKQAQKSLNGFKRIAVSGVGKQLTRAFADVGKALLSPIGAAIISVELLYKITKSFFNYATSASKIRKSNLEDELKQIKKQNEELEEQQKKHNDIIKTLEGLNSQQKLSNVQREYAIQLTNQLEGSYKDVNFQIDQATGKIKNFNQQLQKIQKQQREERIAALEDQIEKAKQMMDTKFNQKFGNFMTGNMSLGDTENDWNWMSRLLNNWQKVWKMRRDMGILADDSLATPLQKEYNRIHKMLEEAGDDYTKRIKVFRQIKRLIQDPQIAAQFSQIINSSEADIIEKNSKQISRLKNVEEQAKQSTNDYVVAQQKKNASYKAQKDSLKQLDEWIKKTQRDREFNNSPAQKQVEMLRNQIAEADTKLAELQNKRSKEIENYLNLPSYQGEIADLQKQIREAITPELKETLNKQLVDLIAKQQDAQAALNESENKQLKIEEEINKTTQQRVKKLNELTDIQKKYGETTKSFFGSQLKGIQSKVYEQAGKSIEYQLKQMKERFKEQYKRDANENEVNAMKDLISVNAEYNRAQQTNPIPIEGTITNELARKGGFASSVVVEDANSLNKRILEASEKQASNSEKMLGKVDKLETTIKQLGILR